MRLGRLLGSGHSFAKAQQILAGLTLEAAMIVRQMGEALPKLTARGMLAPDELPLLRALSDIIVHNRPAQLPLDAFFHDAGPSLWHRPAS